MGASNKKTAGRARRTKAAAGPARAPAVTSKRKAAAPKRTPAAKTKGTETAKASGTVKAAPVQAAPAVEAADDRDDFFGFETREVAAVVTPPPAPRGNPP